MSNSISLTQAIKDIPVPATPEAAQEREALVRSLSDVLLNERLGAEIMIPGVESIAPGRKISMSIVRVLAHRGFVIADDKLQATVSERLGTSMPPTPKLPAATSAAKPMISAAWPALPEVGVLPSAVMMDTPSVRNLESIR